MFSSQQMLDKRTGSEGVGRFEFLKLLTQEFGKTTSLESKKQVLANLANFSYDPINFEYIKQLNVTDIFLAQLSQSEEDLLNFGLAGLCNLSSDPESREYIIRHNGIQLISEHLLHENVDISLNALTTLIYLITPETQERITHPTIIKKVLQFKESEDSRLQNLGIVFLDDYCSAEQIRVAENEIDLTDIPLPSTN